MDFWSVLNSPIVLTLLSFVFGSIIAAAISARWQRRSQKHSVRLLLAQEILNTYHRYIRFLKKTDNYEDVDDFDELHIDMLTKCGMAKVIFSQEVADRLKKLANKMATIQDLRLQAHYSERHKIEKAFEKNLTDVYVEGRLAIEDMFTLIK
jgi:hypothetical protein